MDMKAYILNFDKGGLLDAFNYKNFHNTLTTAKGINNWWHYLETSYIIVTDNNITATNLSDYIRQLMPNKLFFICELNLKNHNGWLPTDAWEWINQFNK